MNLAGCPSVAARPIYQVTLRPGSTRYFAIPATYVGTSMAAAHVSAVAALVLASGALKPKLPGSEGVRHLRDDANSRAKRYIQEALGEVVN